MHLQGVPTKSSQNLKAAQNWNFEIFRQIVEGRFGKCKQTLTSFFAFCDFLIFAKFLSKTCWGTRYIIHAFIQMYKGFIRVEI